MYSITLFKEDRERTKNLSEQEVIAWKKDFYTRKAQRADMRSMFFGFSAVFAALSFSPSATLLFASLHGRAKEQERENYDKASSLRLK